MLYHISCELLSKIVFLQNLKTFVYGGGAKVQLWIAFKNCIFAKSKNPTIGQSRCTASCELLSKIVFLQNLKTLIKRVIPRRSCELLSKIVFLQNLKTATSKTNQSIKLWIAFKNCIFAKSKNLKQRGAALSRVVNCFQKLYFCKI